MKGPTVRFGERELPAIGLGVWQLGSQAWGWNTEFGPADATAIVQRALDLGLQLFDTAEIYGSGASEHLLGVALAGRRDEAFIASKVWPTHYFSGQVRSAADRSLSRLGTDRLDLYQLHWPNPIVPLKRTMAGMRALLDVGVVRAAGVSNFSLSRWQRADRVLGSPVVSNQVPYNLLERGAERDLIPFAQANARVVIAYSPLAQGLLSGRYDADNLPRGFRRVNRLFLPESIRRAQPVLDLLREVATAHGATMAQVALAWVLGHPSVAAIPGAKSVQQVEDNTRAAEIVLTDAEFTALNDVSGAFQAVSRLRSLPQLGRRLFTK